MVARVCDDRGLIKRKERIYWRQRRERHGKRVKGGLKRSLSEEAYSEGGREGKIGIKKLIIGKLIK